jgi:hypothetical protein
LINKKLESIISTALNENEDNYEILFSIFKNILICNDKNKLELKLYRLNYNFTSKYISYLFKSENNQNYVNKIKKDIIDFFLHHRREGRVNEESLIS